VSAIATLYTTSHYRKPTQTDRVLPFSSFHPNSIKKNVIKNEAKRINSHCSEPNSAKKEIQKLQDRFQQGGYPHSYINQALKPNKVNPTKPQHNFCTSIPYLGEASQQIRRILENSGINAYFSNMPNSKTKWKNFEPIPVPQQKNAVYCIPCSKCEGKYIGQTSKELVVRVKQHQEDVAANNQNNALAVHRIESGHLPDWDQTTIIIKEQNKNRRLALETASIIKNSHTLNLTGGKYPKITTLIPSNNLFWKREPPSTQRHQNEAFKQSKPTSNEKFTQRGPMKKGAGLSKICQ
jgi:hypothetical protein